MSLVRTLNNQTVNAPFTFLANPVNAGTNVFQVRNMSGFSASWAVQIGNTGEAQAEILVLNSGTPSGTIGTTTANCLYDHPADTPLFAVKFDQLVFGRSTTGTAGTSSPMTGGTVTIQADGTQTIFDDPTGAVGYAYQTYFQNSVTSLQSSLSDWILSGGLPFYSLGKMRQRVKDKLISSGYLNGVTIVDTEINDWLNEWLEYMTSAAIDVNEDFNLGTMALTFAVNQELGTITATDFRGGFQRVWYIDGSGTYQATKMDSNSYSPNKTFTDTYPYYYMQGDSVIGRQPIDQAGTLLCEYPKLNPVLVEDTDQLPVSMQGYTKSFIDYAHSQALMKDAKVQEAGIKSQEAQAMATKFQTQIAPRNKTGATYIDIVEDTAADQELWL